MNITNIHFHDTRLLRALEDTAEDTLTFEVDYPTNWETNTFERRRIVFDDVLDYRVCEGPFQGAPTILDVQITGEDAAGRCLLQIDTNAGTRYFSCTEVRLLQDQSDGQPERCGAALTVNSSPNSVHAYESYGFVASQPEQCIHGIRFVPMQKEKKK